MLAYLIGLTLLFPHPASSDNRDDEAAIAQMDCKNPAAVEAWFKGWREKKRLGFAWDAAQAVFKTGLPTEKYPFPPGQAPRAFYPKGAACVNDKNAVFAERNGEVFEIGCFMHSKVKENYELSHVFRGEIQVPYNAACLSDKSFHDFAFGKGCKEAQNAAIRAYFMNIGGMAPPPNYRRPPNFELCGIGSPLAWHSQPTVQNFSLGSLNEQVAKTGIRNLLSDGVLTADGERFLVKKGVGPTSTTPGKLTNPLGEWPSSSDEPGGAVDVK